MDESRHEGHSAGDAGLAPEVASSSQPSKGDTSEPVPGSGRASPEGTPPPLPPRRKLTPERGDIASRPGSPSGPTSPLQNLQSRPTTAVSLADTSTAAFPGPPKEISVLGSERRTPTKSLKPKSSRSHIGSDTADSASLSSFAPGAETPADEASLFGDLPGITPDMPAWNSAVGLGMKDEGLSLLEAHDDDIDVEFEHEFDSVGEVGPEGENLDAIIETWKRKRKHFLILSAAGKPIYTRHGDNGLISDYIGIIQTIISFFHEAGNQLKTFSAGRSRIVVYSQGPLHLVAISRLSESEAQLRSQLEALYMQILSTLTLPALQHIFSVRPSSDLRRPLQGTESLLSSLADSFTRGSPSTLLSALECLRLRKSHRQVISNTLLKTKVDPLLYGLVVAGGKLVSVVRPKRHSLHPGDLQLIFNMIFEADGIGAGGGENWIPICLPGFNSNGYLYMYVSFWDLHGTESSEVANKDDSVAIILISADKESFYSLREMRDALVERMEQNGSINAIRTAIEKGRPVATDIVPGTVVRHFLYKSKANVQFTMSSYAPDFTTTIARRRLLSIYHSLHASVHAKHAHVRVEHGVSKYANSLAWVTPTFELYCVAGPTSSRNALSQSASKIAQWAQQESERIFIIGGAVF